MTPEKRIREVGGVRGHHGAEHAGDQVRYDDETGIYAENHCARCTFLGPVIRTTPDGPCLCLLCLRALTNMLADRKPTE